MERKKIRNGRIFVEVKEGVSEKETDSVSNLQART